MNARQRFDHKGEAAMGGAAVTRDTGLGATL
jgi:hypothetical protein